MAEKRFKAHEKERSGTSDAHRSEGPEEGVHSDASGHYQPEMDEMRCILYAHGGRTLLPQKKNQLHLLTYHVSMQAGTTLEAWIKRGGFE